MKETTDTMKKQASKGATMEVSTSTNSAPVETAKDPMKKAMEVQEQQVIKVLEGLDEQSQKINAQKTGMGSSIKLLG